MDGACVYEEKTVLHELTQGIQMAEQLRANLHSAEARGLLMQKILSAYDNALLVLKSRNTAPAPALRAASPPESLISSGSPGSEGFKFDQQPFSVQQGKNVISKRRKRSTTWEEQVRIFSGNNGLEDDTDQDGYNWRKYGQKDILGAKFPRSYYRCSYSKVQKCMATKQVQKIDANPTVFEIAYKGKHRCIHGAQSASPPPPTLPEKNEITLTHHHQQLSPPNPSETLSNFRANLTVDTMVLGGDTLASPIFSLPSTSSGLMDDLDQFHFISPATSETNFPYDDNELWQVYSPPFISPATSETNFLY
ncbi:hypothetical protein SSX86_001431 [Deinandra increscens subsp. villosa]|uniref:WRKY domain-containing protein n=1 Tax=Deinandra increscens subsp. villosa TaxID=3103831 RepID=A0AAP0DUY9_9ASTR